MNHGASESVPVAWTARRMAANADPTTAPKIKEIKTTVAIPPSSNSALGLLVHSQMKIIRMTNGPAIVPAIALGSIPIGVTRACKRVCFGSLVANDSPHERHRFASVAIVAPHIGQSFVGSIPRLYPAGRSAGTGVLCHPCHPNGAIARVTSEQLISRCPPKATA